MKRAYRLCATSLVVVLMVIASGCATNGPTYVDQDASYDAASALKLVETLDPGDLESKPTAQAGELKHDALVALRSKGGDASTAADLLTKTLPSTSSGVPFYVEKAQFESEPAWVVVEAIGRKSGSLSDERLWVFSESGQVLLSGTR